MNNTLCRKILSALFAAAILAQSAALVSCSDKADNTPQSEVSGTAAEEETEPSPYDDKGYLKDDLPELDFKGQEVKLLYWTDVNNQEFESEGITGELINDAIYERNLNAEERLGVKLSFIGADGGGYIDPWVRVVSTSYAAGDKAYDILASYSRAIASCAVKGFTTDLSNIEYLDYEKPWWPKKMLDQAVINGRLHFISGDISTSTLYVMYCIYYNRTLIENYHIGMPTDDVFAGTWTIDRLIEASKGVYTDLNANNRRDLDDFYGFTISNYQNDSFYTGSNLKYVETDPDQILVISDDFYSEKVVDLLAKLGPWEKTEDVYMCTNYTDEHEIPFTNGNALFVMHPAYYAAKALRNTEISYGIIPVPKYDENQKDFSTVLGNTLTLYAIDSECDYPETCAAVLECLGSIGYRTTTPDIYEVYMKVRYSEDDINAQMYDIVRENVCFDLGRYFGPQLSSITDIFHLAAAENNQKWSSTAEGKRKVLDRQIAAIAAAFAD